jgi:hypothetical protein
MTFVNFFFHCPPNPLCLHFFGWWTMSF